jgi:hypothetical protein
LDSITLFGTLTLSGAYPVGGDTIDFTPVIGYQSPNGRIFVPTGAAYPGTGTITGSGGDTFAFVAGTLLNNNKLIANTSSGTVVSGNYGAEITADNNIQFSVTFPKG